jgi:hypothetical protein
MELETQSDSPVVGAIIWIASLGFGFGFIALFLQAAAYIYILVWSLDRWGVFDVGLDDRLVFLEWIRWPI